MAKSTTQKIKITLVRSLIGSTQKQRRVAKALGLTKKDQTVEHENSAVIMGMVNAIPHLLKVSE
jgi:large subunit ribosomal protein L30